MKLLKKLEGGVSGLLGLMGLAGIVVMSLGVVTRYVLKVPLNWSDEFLRTMFVWAYFIGAAMMYSAGGLMHLELLDDFFEKHSLHGVKVGIHIFIEVFSAVFFAFMTFYVYNLICSYVAKGTTSSTSNVPAWVLILGMGIGFALIAVFAVRNIIRLLKREMTGNRKAEA